HDTVPGNGEGAEMECNWMHGAKVLANGEGGNEIAGGRRVAWNSGIAGSKKERHGLARTGKNASLPVMAHAPETIACVVRHDERTLLVYGHAYRPSPDVARFGDESSHEVNILAERLAILHRHTDHLVTGPSGAVPGTVFRRERPAAILRWELFGG